jgi:hypothetical protein
MYDLEIWLPSNATDTSYGDQELLLKVHRFRSVHPYDPDETTQPSELTVYKVHVDEQSHKEEESKRKKQEEV